MTAAAVLKLVPAIGRALQGKYTVHNAAESFLVLLQHIEAELPLPFHHLFPFQQSVANEKPEAFHLMLEKPAYSQTI